MDDLPPGSTPIYEGELHKQSQWIKDWRPRFFRLYTTPAGPRLYFMTEKGAPPHGCIDLSSCLTVKSADDKTGKANSFEVATAEQTYFMYAATSAKKDEVRRARASRVRHRARCARRRLTAVNGPTNHPLAVGRSARPRDCAREPQLSCAGRRR
jgi:hypothetical protein